jgi:hypothetical protein
MQTAFALAGLVLSLLPSAAFAAPTHKVAVPKKAVAVTASQCSKYHMSYTAAQAKKNHYKDPMDGDRLVPVTQR